MRSKSEILFNFEEFYLRDYITCIDILVLVEFASVLIPLHLTDTDFSVPNGASKRTLYNLYHEAIFIRFETTPRLFYIA